MDKPVPLHMRLFNAAFKLPFLSFKAKERIAHSFLSPEKSKELRGMMHDLVGGMNQQFGTYEAILEYAPNYAKWNTPEEVEKIQGGKLVASGCAMASQDYWSVKALDLFFAKYVTSAADHEAFCHAVYRLAFSMQEWGYIDGESKPKKLTDEQEAELLEMQWSAMSMALADEMKDKGKSAQQWMTELKPLFYPQG
jgi:hypothetical protein